MEDKEISGHSANSRGDTIYGYHPGYHPDAPMPWIGVYIAASSVVCCLLMLYDIMHGFIKKQRWLPCNLFKLNSVTLTIIAVVVKLTVDLTTCMAEDLDQLSKLTGTTSLCIYMSYIFPSLGELKDTTNMYALSLLVIIVMVNICIQFSTRVIHYYIPGHIIILCFMLFLLLVLWHFVLTGKNRYSSEIVEYKSGFISGKGSFLWRLKVCYLQAYMSNPQFVACMQMDYGTVGDISIILFILVIPRTIATIITLKEVSRSSYGWSMRMIVWTQIITISIGSFVSYFRRFTMSSHVRSYEILKRAPIEEPYMSNPIWSHKFFLVKVANILYITIIFLSYWSVSLPVRVFDWLKSKLCCVSRSNFMDKKIVKAFQDLGYKDEWALQNSIADMENLMKESKRSTSKLFNILSRTPTTSPRYPGPGPRDLILTSEDLRIPARLLSLTVLVKVVEASMPESTSCNTILETFKEVFDTLHFIEKYEQVTRRKDMEVAKAIWMASGFRRFLPVKLIRGNNKSPPPLVDHAFSIIQHICEKMGNDEVGRRVLQIKDFVMLRTYSSADDLGYFMEDLFVDLLDPLLAQLPEAIFKAVTESPDDTFEERVRESLKHLCKFESFDGIERWELPKGCENLPGLIDPEVPSSQHSEVHAVQDEQQNQGITGIDQLPETSNLHGSPSEGNQDIRSDDHSVTISDEDEIVQRTLL